MVFKAIDFARAVKTKRAIDLDIGLREAAIEIGISYATLSRIENKKVPDLMTYAKVCEWLKVDMKSFFKK